MQYNFRNKNFPSKVHWFTGCLMYFKIYTHSAHYTFKIKILKAIQAYLMYGKRRSKSYSIFLQMILSTTAWNDTLSASCDFNQEESVIFAIIKYVTNEFTLILCKNTLPYTLSLNESIVLSTIILNSGWIRPQA